MAVVDEIEFWLRSQLSVGMGSARHSSPVPLEPVISRSGPFHRLAWPGGQPVFRPNNPPDQWAYIQVRTSPRDEHTPARALQWAQSPGTTGELILEFILRRGIILTQLVVAETDAGTVMAQLRGQYPGVEVGLGADLLNRDDGTIRQARSYCLKNPHPFPIEVKPDPERYRVLSGVATGLSANSTLVVQIRCRPVLQDWEEQIRGLGQSPWLSSGPSISNIPGLEKHALAKIASYPFYAAAFRIAGTNPEDVSLLEEVVLPQFESASNGLRLLDKNAPVSDFLGRVGNNPGMVLNLFEKSLLMHLPAPDQIGRHHLEIARMNAPAPGAALSENLIILGNNTYQGVTREAGLSESWATRPLALVGATGSGKTTGLRQIESSLAGLGYGYIKLCSKQEDFEASLDQIPESRKSGARCLDFATDDYVPAMNMLHSSNERDNDQLASDALVILRRVTEHWGGQMESILLYGLRTMLALPEEKNLRDLYRFLINEEFRTGLLGFIEDPELLEFWELIFPKLPASASQPVLNKLNRFMSRARFRNIACQANLVDFQQIIRENRIMIINLDKGKLGEDVAVLLGMTILSRLQLAAVARPLKDRKLYPIIVDEAHNYFGRGADTEGATRMLSENRSAAMPIYLATQYLDQIDPPIRRGLLSNMGTLIALRCSAKDADILHRELGIFGQEDLLNLRVGEALVRLGESSSAFNVDLHNPPRPAVSSRQEIIQASRQQYCRPRKEVEESLKRSHSFRRDRVTETHPSLDPDQRQFLEFVADHPESPITNAQRELGLGGYKAQRIRSQLEKQGYLLVLDTRLGRGSTRAKYGVPTRLGLELLGKQVPGRGGPIHKHLQGIVASFAQSKGYTAELEKRLPSGQYVDLHLACDEEMVAVEISVVPDVLREIQNMEKCLAAGYDRVLALFADETAIPEAAAEAQKRWPDCLPGRLTVSGFNGLNRLL